MNAPGKSHFAQALDALRAGDRPSAARHLRRQLEVGNTAPKNLPTVGQLAMQIGEVDLSIEAARQGMMPGSLETAIAYWSALAMNGRADDAVAAIAKQTPSVQQHPFVLHYRGVIANQIGQFDAAEDLFRQTLAKLPASVDTWFSLAMLKTFEAGDPDITAMETLLASPQLTDRHRASLRYGLGKAMEDVGDIDAAFAHYHEGAALRRREAPFDVAAYVASAEQAMRDFTPATMKRLTPSRYTGQRSLFVTGMPRSGTTLTEQILRSHSAVEDGAEINLYGSALIACRGSFDGAMALQRQSRSADPWGDVARDYADLTDRFFRTSGLVVDKSLGQSMITGLMLHSAPDGRIAWLRRNPDDIALSCFRTYFTTGLNWTWSLTDIAEVMRVEDRLFEHWLAMYPDRILPIPYEELAAQPAAWAVRLQEHFGLPVETSLESVPRDDRIVRTASVGQVRGEITTSRIGRAAAFARHLAPFRERYEA